MNGFPDYTPETGLPAWQRIRVEDLPFWKTVLKCPLYFRKSVQKKKSAPPEVLEYFDRQRQIFDYLMGASRLARGPRIALVGDIMWLRDSWHSFLDEGVLDYLNDHEVVLGNLESPISPQFKIPSRLPDYLTYNSNFRLVTSFRRPSGDNTFTALSLSNNHALDRGELGARDTQDLLDGLEILHSGVVFDRETRPYVVFEADGFRFGFYAAAWGLNSFVKSDPNVHVQTLPPGVFADGAEIDLPEIRQVMADMAADGCDLRIVALHWGTEYEYYPYPAMMRVGREIVREGADIILGTHPHVQQPCETLFVNGYEERLPESLRPLAADATVTADGPPRKALIAYSMGNFATTMFTFACHVGWILSLWARRDLETGRPDWQPHASSFVVNVPRTIRQRERHLFLLDDYRKWRAENGGLRPKEEEYLAFLAEHLFGGFRP